MLYNVGYKFNVCISYGTAVLKIPSIIMKIMIKHCWRQFLLRGHPEESTQTQTVQDYKYIKQCELVVFR